MKKLFLIFILFAACSSEDAEPDESRLGLDFYPIEVGTFQIYHVDNTNYRISGDVEQTSYELKVEVVDSFYNQTNTLTYITHRSERADENMEWQFRSAWPVRITPYQIIQTEDNIPYIKLSLPVENGKEWDGNASNTYEEDIYEMDSINSSYITSISDTINSTVTVVQNDNQDFTVQLDRRYEIYGRNVGLVYKEDISLQYCTDADCIGQQQVIEGYEYRQYLIDYGKN
ncbi:hypothetical protein LVD15_21875 [Fulvivirga maritima]|uniref:hypothetical protein n=1 Tax=Fulvivirga maritima TaxID=2904247 RepID=UPI001F2566F1|nr:hypothetical protein [Fulvivirga maritima]UII25922.1 hypothetical protein LVD15_21875 [Fulvivirga maritima]